MRSIEVPQEPAAIAVQGLTKRFGRATAGHGLVGMRERVALLGGELQVGPAPDGRFRVAARLPVGDGA